MVQHHYTLVISLKLFLFIFLNVLLTASKNGHLHVVNYLIRETANKEIKTNNGFTPLLIGQ